MDPVRTGVQQAHQGNNEKDSGNLFWHIKNGVKNLATGIFGWSTSQWVYLLKTAISAHSISEGNLSSRLILTFNNSSQASH